MRAMSPMFIAVIVAVLSILLITRPSHACLWDNDTLQDERRGLPGMSEILAGKWERHSRYFYEQRAGAMTARLARDPKDLDAYDNLAVAYEKIGEIPRAIDTILKKESIKPGEYTTYANLGTFYLHAGDLDHGIEFIRKAMEINPDAHFGRERYQLMVAEYLRRAKSDATVLDGGSFVMPMLLASAGMTKTASTQAALTTEQSADQARLMRLYLSRRNDPATVNKAIEGVVGMIRFGTGTSAHLYFALGDLLAVRGDKHLAYRAYKRALDFNHPRPELLKEAMNQMWRAVEYPSDFDDATIARERADADAWLAACPRARGKGHE
jgi:tetratricopeptide (TPR) repeat protein